MKSRSKVSTEEGEVDATSRLEGPCTIDHHGRDSIRQPRTTTFMHNHYGSLLSMSTNLGTSETNCNECRRRKGKCDRVLPECTSCSRNRRHCLYEKAAGRTPLTRKNLTEAEEKLRRAEMRARLAERRAIAAEEKLACLMPTGSVGNVSEPSPPINGNANYMPSVDRGACLDSEAPVHLDVLEQQLLSLNDNYQLDVGCSGLPEEPPSEIDDFSWDEISRTTNHHEDNTKQHEIAANVKDEEIVDGMASLTVEERGAGYLGTSSGAAMLRLLMPDVEPRDSTRQRRRTNIDENFVYDNKDLAYEELGLADIDLDSAIDAYFASYHLQYPLIHEPTFRAQYSSIIPRPNGMAFEALVYMLGAIGLFSTANTTTEKNNDDLKLFEAAKLNIKIDVLEKGNVTLLQVLALMSNYLQKRGKPNRYASSKNGLMTPVSSCPCLSPQYCTDSHCIVDTTIWGLLSIWPWVSACTRSFRTGNYRL